MNAFDGKKKALAENSKVKDSNCQQIREVVGTGGITSLHWSPEITQVQLTQVCQSQNLLLSHKDLFTGL